MLARSRALIVFADSCSDLPSGLSRQSSLNRVAEQGVTGWLTLRRPENGGRNGGVALAQLLGVMPEYISSAGGDVGKLTGFDKGASGSVGIKARYGGMDVRVVTNQTASMGLQASLGVPCTLVETDFCGEESARQSSEAVLTEVRALCEDSAEVIIVHLDASAGGDGAQGSEKELVGCNSPKLIWFRSRLFVTCTERERGMDGCMRREGGREEGRSGSHTINQVKH